MAILSVVHRFSELSVQVMISLRMKDNDKKRRPWGWILILLGMLTLTGGCAHIKEQGSTTWKCTPVPHDFQESNLIGIWRAKYAANATDTLMLWEDGTYKQIFDDPIPAYHYESGRNNWWLEKRDSGGLYLHLELMRRCDGISSLCKEQEGGGEFLWWDFCEDRVIKMPEEVVLIVTGVPEGYKSSPRDIWLQHLKKDPDTGGFYFTFLSDKIDTATWDE